jgi:hypothetical protein
MLLNAINAAPSGLLGAVPGYRPDKNQGAHRAFITIMQAAGSFRLVARLIEAAGP